MDGRVPMDQAQAVRFILGQAEPGPFPITLVWRESGVVLRRSRTTVEDPNARVGDLRGLVEREFAIPAGGQRLFGSNGRPLGDGEAASGVGDAIYVEEVLDCETAETAEPAAAPPVALAPVAPPPAPAPKLLPARGPAPPRAPSRAAEIAAAAAPGADPLGRLDALAAAEHVVNAERMRRAGITGPRGPTIVDGRSGAETYANFTSPTGSGQLYEAAGRGATEPGRAPRGGAAPRTASDRTAAMKASFRAAGRPVDAAPALEAATPAAAAGRKRFLAAIVHEGDACARSECLVARLVNGTSLKVRIDGSLTVGDLRGYAEGACECAVEILDRSPPPTVLDDDAAPLKPGLVVCQRSDGARPKPRAIGDDRTLPTETIEISVGDAVVRGSFRGLYLVADDAFNRAGMAVIALGAHAPAGTAADLQGGLHLPSFAFNVPEAADGSDAVAAVLAHFQRQSPLLVIRALVGHGGGAAAALSYVAGADPRRSPGFLALLAPKSYLPSLPIGRIEAKILVVHKPPAASARNAERFRRRHPGDGAVELKERDFGCLAAVADDLNDALEGARRF